MALKLANDCIDTLKSLLTRSGLQKETLEKFGNIRDTAGRMKFVQNLLLRLNIQVDNIQLRRKKSHTIALHYCNEGAEFYECENFRDALEAWNKALCFASSRQEAATIYANRSIIFFDLELFAYCLRNILLAKSHGYSGDMEKLLEREKFVVCNVLSCSDILRRRLLHQLVPIISSSALILIQKFLLWPTVWN
jgi:hypothetical protein